MTTAVEPDEFKLRPGARLRDLLAKRKLDPADFAIACEMARPPDGYEHGSGKHRDRARAALRHYTAGERAPGLDLICRWAAQLEVDPGYFWAPSRKRKKARN